MDQVSLSRPPPPGMTRASPSSSRQEGRSPSSPAAAQEEGPRDPQVNKLERLQSFVDKAFQDENLRLSIRYDEDSRRFIYRGLDPETGEIKRVIPAEEVVSRIALFRELTGLQVDEKT